jgi:nucleotide-binding universal stress UspA family protein
MTNTPRPVVVGFDFSATATAALQRAIGVAIGTPAYRLHVVCAIERGGDVPTVPRDTPVDYLYAERVQRAVADVIGMELHLANADNGLRFHVHARLGKAADEILAVAGEVGADLIVIGSHGHVGLERLLLGSVAERVVREAGCSVEVARAKTYRDVSLVEVTEVEPTHSYVPPHRYFYEDHRVMLRPAEWPLY